MFEVNTADWRTVLSDYQTLIAKSREYNFERWDILTKPILYNPDALSDPVMLEIYKGQEYQYFIEHLTGWFSSRYRNMRSVRVLRFN